jgi:hypothetical protein
MSGVSAGVSGSYGQENSTLGSTTTSNSKVKSVNDFNSLMNELMHGTTSEQIMAPQWARQGGQGLFNRDVASTGVAQDFLTSLMSDPYGASGGGRFAPAIKHMFDSALSGARSGADVSGMGAARQGFREGEALAGAQRDVLGLGTGAANSMLSNVNPQNALNFAALIAAKKGTADTNRSQNTTGQSTTNTMNTGKSNMTGFNDSSSWGVGGGVGCCFIFMEAYKGEGNMPWFVRRCRDEFATGRRVLGYRRMANWAVPMMQRSGAFRRAIDWLMIRPLTSFGGWLYAQPGYKYGWLAAPITAAWFGFWKHYAPKSVTEV